MMISKRCAMVWLFIVACQCFLFSQNVVKNDSVGSFPCGFGFGNHEHECFALDYKILESLQSRNIAIYGTRSSLAFDKDGRPYKKSCPLVDPNFYVGPVFISFRRCPKSIEFYRPMLGCMLLGEWNIKNDTVVIEYQVIVSDDSVRYVSQQQVTSFGAPKKMLFSGARLVCIDYDSNDPDYVAVKDINPYLSSILEDQGWGPFESFSLIYGDENWWKNE